MSSDQRLWTDGDVAIVTHVAFAVGLVSALIAAAVDRAGMWAGAVAGVYSWKAWRAWKASSR